jgi:hypothetical protein
MSPTDQALFIATMQSWMGMLNWLPKCTRLDLATTFSLLDSRTHCPNPGHLDAVKWEAKFYL